MASSNLLSCVSGGSTKQFTDRRSANFQPNIWTHEFIQALGNNHHLPVETLEERATKLEEKVRVMINGIITEMEPLSVLELIDDIERLGLSYRFEECINKALHRIDENFKDQTKQISLHETALHFRILRQHGFHVCQDVFKSFKNEEGKLKAEIRTDAQGMLSLYEASYLTFEGESLWEANAFSRTHIMNSMKEGRIDAKMAEKVKHVLEGLPYHQSFHRLEARWYINTYDKIEPHNRLLLELAKLNFNIVQSTHQKELKEVSRWWRDTGLASKVKFARERIVEPFSWSLAMLPQPQFTHYHGELTKVGVLVTLVDDVYDIYGTLDELEIFTNAVERWDLNSINTLPDCLVLCFMAVYNFVNLTAYDIFKQRGIKALPYLTKAWSDLCKAYLLEAKWFYNRVIPPFNEYLENARITIAGGVILAHSYFFVSKEQDITEQALDSLISHHDLLLRSSVTILRLNDDLGTSKDEIERGETSNSIVSYMCETALSEENARQYFKILIDREWQNMNKYLVMKSIFPKSFIQVIFNLARIAQYTYQYGDGYGQQDNISKSRIKSLLVYPIPIDMAS